MTIMTDAESIEAQAYLTALETADKNFLDAQVAAQVAQRAAHTAAYTSYFATKKTKNEKPT